MNKISIAQLQQLVDNTRMCMTDVKDAIHTLSLLVDSESALHEDEASKIINIIKSYVDNWKELQQFSDQPERKQTLTEFDLLINELKQAESLDNLRNIIVSFFRITATSEKYTPILEDAKKELQSCCRLDHAEINAALIPYEITVRAIQGEDISDEDDDILMENGNAVHQVYFKRLKMTIDPNKNILGYMDGSCPLLTDTETTTSYQSNPIPEPPAIAPAEPLWPDFCGYVSDAPIYIENNPEAEKAFQAKEFGSRMKSHPYQAVVLDKLNDNVVWPINVPQAWDDQLEEITYFVNHGYIVKVGYEENQPLFYMLSEKGKAAFQFIQEKIYKQSKAMSQSHYPDVKQLTVLNLKRLYAILDFVMTSKPSQCSYLRTTKDWYRQPYACAYEKDSGHDYMITAGFFSIGTEAADVAEIYKVLGKIPDVELHIIVNSIDDARYISSSSSTNTDTPAKICYEMEIDSFQNMP